MAALGLEESDDQLTYHSAFHSQQAIEKLLKAVLVATNRHVELMHDLDALVELCREETDLPEELDRAEELTDFVTVGRYPDLPETVTMRDAQDAYQLASKLTDLLLDVLGDLGVDLSNID